MAKKKIAYTTSRLNRNLESVTANDSKNRRASERSLSSALLVLQYSSSRFSDYRILRGEFLWQAYCSQMIDHDSLKAKEYLYLCAVCQKIVCQYYKPSMQKTDGPYEVDLHQLDKWEAAVVADAEELAVDLGIRLLQAEGTVIHPFQIHRGKALYGLFSRNAPMVEDAIHSLKEGGFPRLNATANQSAWRLGQAFQDILCQNEQGVNDYLAEQLSRERKGYHSGVFLNLDLLAVAKIAARWNLKVELDTIECPKELIVPEETDYSSVEIPIPKEGFPWDGL